MDSQIAKAIGTTFIAIVLTLPEELRHEACNTLARAAEDPSCDPDLAHFYRTVHHSATADREQLRLETARLENGDRPRLTIVGGGDAA